MKKVPDKADVDTDQIPYDESVSYDEIAEDNFEYDGKDVRISVRDSNRYNIRIRIDDMDLDTVAQIGVEWAYQYEFSGNRSVFLASNGDYKTRYYKLSRLYYRDGREFLEEDLRDGN